MLVECLHSTKSISLGAFENHNIHHFFQWDSGLKTLFPMPRPGTQAKNASCIPHSKMAQRNKYKKIECCIWITGSCEPWTYFSSLADFLVADRSGMAAWMLPCCVAMCIKRFTFATGGCNTHCNGCVHVAQALFWEVVGARNLLLFSGNVAAADNERYCVCVCGRCGAFVLLCDWFLLCVLQWVARRVCVLLFACWIPGCRWQWNGCMNVAMLCCHVRRCQFAMWCCKTHCIGCNQVPWHHGCVRNTIIFCRWTS